MNKYKYWMLIWFIIGVTVGLLIPTGSANAQQGPICRPRHLIIDRLKLTYNEDPKHIALAAGGKVLEVLVNEKGGWTMMVTDTEGKACIIAIGEAWEDVPWPLPSIKGQGT